MSFSVERLLGRALRSVRAGDRRLAWNAPALAGVPESIRLESPAFAPGGAMPRRCAGAGVGDNISPPLAWTGIPPGAAELILIVEDPDAPAPRPIVHAVATGIPPDWTGLAEGALSPPSPAPMHIRTGSFGRVGWAGPRPVLGHGPHRYIFQILAIAPQLKLAESARLPEILSAAAGHVVARGRLVGSYERP